MKLTSIRLVNYRCFADRTIEFAATFNVFAGRNGSGKTTLLKAISESLAGVVMPLPGTFPLGVLNDEADYRMEVVDQKGRVRFERRFPVEIHATAEIAGETVSWAAVKPGAVDPSRLQGRFPGLVIMQANPPLNTMGPARISPLQTLPLIAFYRAGRHWNQPQPGELQSAATKYSRMDAYRNWQDASLDVQNLQAWSISKSLERAQTSSESGTPFHAVTDDELALVNAALADALEDAGGLYYDLRQKSLLVQWRRDSNHRLPASPLNSLSDGQQAIVGLVVDIARRMCLLNPHLGKEVTRKTPGVILIDELDIHLHPEWQRVITKGLKLAFPAVQFIAATHSPQVLSELEPDEIIIVGAEGTTHPEASYGLDSSRILEEVMAAVSRPAEIATILRSIYESLERNDLDKARQETEALSQQTPHLPELERIKALLTRKAAIGR